MVKAFLMTTHRHPLRGLAALCLLAFAPCAQAVVHHFTFTQSGYPRGAYVTGSLFLNDANGDGVISDDGFLGDSLGGHMRLIGHPIHPDLTVPFYAGFFNLQTLDFGVHGDAPSYPDFNRLIGAFLTPSRGGFSNLRDSSPIYSDDRVMLQRVPDDGITFVMFATALLLLVGGMYGHGRTRVPTLSCSTVTVPPPLR